MKYGVLRHHEYREGEYEQDAHPLLWEIFHNRFVVRPCLIVLCLDFDKEHLAYKCKVCFTSSLSLKYSEAPGAKDVESLSQFRL